MSQLLKSRSRNSAFTLVELLIVIAIIGILASLATVGVMKVLERSKMVTARIEIGQLEAAVSAAKLDLGNVDELPSVIYVLRNTVNFSSPTILAGESAFIFELRKKTWLAMQKAFGRNVGKNSVTNTYDNGATPPVSTQIIWPCPEGKVIQGMQAYMFWLGGVNTNSSGKYSFNGFSTDKRDPCETAAPKRKGPYFDFDSSRVKNIGNMPGSTYLTYVNGWEGEYTLFKQFL
jgi:prepilin-type N-terminal cleavage/methylation domain-containing protein